MHQGILTSAVKSCSGFTPCQFLYLASNSRPIMCPVTDVIFIETFWPMNSHCAISKTKKNTAQWEIQIQQIGRHVTRKTVLLTVVVLWMTIPANCGASSNDVCQLSGHRWLLRDGQNMHAVMFNKSRVSSVHESSHCKINQIIWHNFKMIWLTRLKRNMEKEKEKMKSLSPLALSFFELRHNKNKERRKKTEFSQHNHKKSRGRVLVTNKRKDPLRSQPNNVCVMTKSHGIPASLLAFLWIDWFWLIYLSTLSTSHFSPITFHSLSSSSQERQDIEEPLSYSSMEAF